jgi:maltose alpha-D-glucosyltransferase/alpha-amylase
VPAASGRLQFQPTPAYAGLVDAGALADAAIARPGSAGAHTLVLVGETLQLKLLRRVLPGTHPELALSRFLTEQAGFAHVPAVAGALAHVADDGTPTTLALLQAQVPHQDDARGWVAAWLDRLFDDWRTDPAAAPADVHASGLGLLQALGTRSAELHRALSLTTGDASFDPAPMDAADWVADVGDTLALARAVLDQLAARPAPWPPALRGPVRALLGQRDALLRRISQAGAGTGPTRKTRVHGGYALERVLLARHELVLTGFGNGSPQAFEAGRRLGAPLRDVAGMLQSFSRARLAALQRLGTTTEPTQALRRLARGWEQQARQAFLAAYDAAAPEPAAPNATQPAAQPAGGWLWLYECDAALQALQMAVLQGDDPAAPLLALAELSGRGDAPPPPARA